MPLKPFTEKYLKSIKPSIEQTRFRDERELGKKGFGISIFPSGEKSFFYIYHYHGRKRRLTLGKFPDISLENAHILYEKAKKELKEGIDPAAKKQCSKVTERDASTIEGLIETYIENYAKEHKRSWKEDKRILDKEILRPWGKRKAKDIMKSDVLAVLDRIKARGAHIAANRTFACLRKMFNFARQRDIISTSPCADMQMPSKEKQRDRCLSVDEIKVLWNSLDKLDIKTETENNCIVRMSHESRLAIKFQLATAQRKGEIASMEWREINLETRWWTIPAAKAKNGVTHRVYLNDMAMEILAEAKRLNDETFKEKLIRLDNDRNKNAIEKQTITSRYQNASQWVFSSWSTGKHLHPSAISRGVNRSEFSNNIANFCPHDCRRTAATHMTAMGISRLVVSKVLNHVDSTITAIYDRHSYDAEKKFALEAWGHKLSELIIKKESSSNIINLQKCAE